MDPYALRHLAAHIARTNNIPRLYELATSQVWLETSRRHDPSLRQFLGDVEIAFDHIETAILADLEASQHDTLVFNISGLTALAWLSAQLNQSASILSPDSLEAMAWMGNHDQALRRAQTVPDPLARAKSLVQVGIGIAKGKQREPALDIFKQVAVLLEGAPNDVFDEKYVSRAKLIVAFAQIGESGRARNLTHSLSEEVQAGMNRKEDITVARYRALAKAWACIGEDGNAKDALLEIFDPDFLPSAALETAITQLVVSGKASPVFLDLALDAQEKLARSSSFETLAELLALYGREEEAYVLMEKQGTSNRIRILRAGLAYAYSNKLGEALFRYSREILEEIAKMPSSTERLETTIALILGAPRDQAGAALKNLLPGLQEGFEQWHLELEGASLGRCALAFLYLDDRDHAQRALEKALEVKTPELDWDKSYLLIDLAHRFGLDVDAPGLAKVLAWCKATSDPWQQAEGIVAVALAAHSMDQADILQEATDSLIKIAADTQLVADRPNLLGSLAVWYAKDKDDPTDPLVVSTIDKALQLLIEQRNPDSIAMLGHTFTRYGFIEWGRKILDQAVSALHAEEDPNLTAHAIGTIAELALKLKDEEILRDLEQLALDLADVDAWLSAEGLFWLSGWQAAGDKARKARGLFTQALTIGAWEDLDPEQIEQALDDPARFDLLLEVGIAIEWPSTQAAALFALLSMLYAQPPTSRFSFGLQLLDLISVPYSEKRSTGIGLMAQADERTHPQPEGIIHLTTAALRQSKARHTGEIWATVRACMPFLYRHVEDKRLPRQIWDELDKLEQYFG